MRAREILAITCGLYAAGRLVVYPQAHASLYLAIYLGAAVVGILRLWPARALGVGVALGTLAQWLRADTPSAWPWFAWVNLVALALLCWPDLVARWEGAPSRWRFLPNPWAALPPALLTRLRWSLYAAGVLVSCLCQQYFWSGQSAWPATPLVIGVLALSMVGLVLGRAIALLPLAVLGGALVVTLVPLALGADPAFDASAYGARTGAQTAAVAALVMTILSAPSLVRLLRQRGNQVPW